MAIQRYRKSLILFFVVFILMVGIFSILQFTGLGKEPRFTPFLPFDSMAIQVALIFSLIPIAGIIGSLFPGYLLAPLFLFVYKKTIGFKMEFGIQDREKSSKFKNTWKGIFPALLIINLSLIFGTSIIVGHDIIVSEEYLATGPGKDIWPIVGFVSLLPFMTGIATGIFSPVWFLLDSGIVFTNKKKVLYKVDPIEVRSIGGWYQYLLKGYAGIGVIVTYIQFVGTMLGLFTNPFDGGFISSVIFLPMMPIIVSILLIPSIVLLEITLKSRRTSVRKFAKKVLHIEGPLEDPLNINKNLIH